MTTFPTPVSVSMEMKSSILLEDSESKTQIKLLIKLCWQQHLIRYQRWYAGVKHWPKMRKNAPQTFRVISFSGMPPDPYSKWIIFFPCMPPDPYNKLFLHIKKVSKCVPFMEHCTCSEGFKRVTHSFYFTYKLNKGQSQNST